MLKSFLIVVVVSSCKRYPPPLIESCIHDDTNSAQCYDPRLEESKREYERTNLENYICTNPDDYNSLYKYTVDLREKLIKCEADLNNP